MTDPAVEAINWCPKCHLAAWLIDYGANTAVCMNCQTARKLNEKDWNDKREFDADTKLINDLER